MHMYQGRRRGTRRSVTVAASTGALVLLAACGGGVSGSDGDESTPNSITIAYAPNVDLQPGKIAIEQGFLADQGLEGELVTVTEGAQEFPLMLNGQLDIGGITIFNVLSAINEGIPIRFLPIASRISSDPETASLALLTASNTSIAALSDLEGRTIAVNSLYGGSHVSTMALLKEAGVDPDSVNFVTLPYNQQFSALEAGRVDAVVQLSPFLQDSLASGAQVLAYPQEALPGGIWNVYFVLEDFATENPDVVNRFVEAMQAANEYANANPEEVQRLAAETANAPVELSPRIPEFVRWEPEIIDQWVPLYNEFSSEGGLSIPPGSELMVGD